MNTNLFLLIDRIRFCFYGATVPAFNLNPSITSYFYNKIYYSLLPNSPDFLYINPFDGCVKISSSFDLNFSYLKSIQYSVGL